MTSPHGGDTPRDPAAATAPAGPGGVVYVLGGRHIAADAGGYLRCQEDWSEELMEHIAALHGLQLGDDHRLVIAMVRSYYHEYAAAPAMRELLRLLRRRRPELGSSAALARLFPQGAAAMAARLAGLPRPARCM